MLLDNINNYYEQLVHDRIMDVIVDKEGITDQGFLEDVACVALNRLPARYVRHSVDLVFYMTALEIEAIHTDVQDAVNEAYEIVGSHKEGPKRRPSLENG